MEILRWPGKINFFCTIQTQSKWKSFVGYLRQKISKTRYYDQENECRWRVNVTTIETQQYHISLWYWGEEKQIIINQKLLGKLS